MGKCKFLKQKKQVQINGEWVDTRSYRYILYCDGSIPCVIITHGTPYGCARVRTYKLNNDYNKYKSIQLDYKGYGYLQLESDDVIVSVQEVKNDGSWSSKATAEIRGCYVRKLGSGNPYPYPGILNPPPVKQTFPDTETLILSCSTYYVDSMQCTNGFEFYGKNLIFKGIDTSKVTDMALMFKKFPYIKSLDLSDFDTRNVITMSGMFQGCSALTSLNISSFDTSNVVNMSTYRNCEHDNMIGNMGMFEGCSSLTSLDVRHFNTSKVENMAKMFSGCRSLTSLDLSTWDVSNVTTMSGMFDGCSGLKSLDFSNFNTSNVTTMEEMFQGCSGLISLDLSNFNTSKITDMSRMFANCSNITSLKLSNLKPSNLRYLSNMFYGCSGITSLDLSGWNTSNVTGQSMSNIFYYCSNLESLDLSGWDMSKITHASSEDDYMFKECPKLKTIRAVGCSEESIFRLRGQLAYVGMENQVTIITE